MHEWLTIEQIVATDDWYKFVRVGDEFRFTALQGLGRGHASLVRDGETASDAGLISVEARKKSWSIRGWDSASLKVWLTEDGVTKLEVLFAAHGLTREAYP